MSLLLALAGGGAVTHSTSGALVGQGALVVGGADRADAGVIHGTSGVLTGPGAIIVGQAELPGLPQGTGGGDGTWIRKQNRARDVKFQEERERKDELRQLLKRALDPVADEDSVELVAVDDGVVVIPAAGPAVAVPLPEGIDLDALEQAIGRILAEAQVRAEQTQRAQAQEIARVALERAREEAIRLRRRRREEEVLLFM